MVVATNRVLGYARAFTLIVYALIVFFVTAAVMTSISIAPASANSGFVVGDTGPGGGKIFYVNSQGFPCGPDGSATCNYLEAAPSGWHGVGYDPSRTWSQSTPVNYQGTSVNNPKAWETGIGRGYSNTRAIINQGSTDPATSAAALADAYTVTVSGVVYDDWYLPSSSELYEMWRQRNELDMNNSVAIDGADRYWSSTEAGSDSAWHQSIWGVGDQSGSVARSKSSSLYVRPVRALQGAPAVTTFSSATSTPRNDSNASYNLVFSQSVTGLEADDFVNIGTATGCTFSVSGSGTTYTLTISNCSDGTIRPRLQANSVTGSIFVGPTTVATASTTITIDSVAPTATVTTATILATSNTSVQSSEIGTAYLVNETVSVTNLASITSAADNLWNSAAISSANTNTNLSASGLRSGTYKVYTVDAAGNLSAASINTISIKPATPGTPDLNTASDLGTSSTDNNTADDTPTFTVSSLETGAVVTLTATPATGSPVSCPAFTATTTSGSCTFTTAIPNGTYSITAVQSFGGVNSDTSTALANVVINKTTITAGTPDLDGASDSGFNYSVNPFDAFGVSNSDDITNDNTPTINVSGSSSGTRTVTATKAGSSVSCTLESGAYTCGTAQSPLADGIWSITVTDTNSSGNSATSAALSVTIDTVPPAEFGGSYAERVTVPPGTNIQIQVPEAGRAQLRNQIASTEVKSALIPIAQANTSYTVQVPALNGTVIQIGQCYYLYAFDIAGNYRQSRNVVVCTASAAAPSVGSLGICSWPGCAGPIQVGNYMEAYTPSLSLGSPSAVLTYKWYQCTPSPETLLGGETNSRLYIDEQKVGKSFKVEITATNVEGSSSSSTNCYSILPYPGPPTSLVAASSNGSVTISFTAPSYVGNGITSYLYSTDGTNYVELSSSSSPVTISGLTNGTTYSIRLKARNSTGNSLASSAVSVTPASVPAAPTVGVATATGPDSASIAFTAPTSNGGSAITSYTVTSSPGSITATGTSSPISISGLSAGTAYTFTVKANNTAGSSVASSASASISTNAATAPGAPTIGAATATSSTSANVAFTAPTSNGGSAIISYTVTSSPGSITATGTSSPIAITGLTAGTPYTFTITATNNVGTSSASSSSTSITTDPIVAPGAPTNVFGTATGQTTARVTFTAPTSTGGAAITSYVVTSSPSGATCTVGANSTTYECSGLTAGTAYTFSITATNAAGLTSSSSSPSSSITTESAPIQNNNNGGGGGGGGGAPAPAPEPAPEPVCNAACVAAQNAAAKAAAERAAAERAAAEKAAAEKAAAEKVAAEKLTADKAAAVAVAEKTKVDVSAAATAATAAVEKATAAAAAKVDVDTVAAAVSTIVNSTNSSAAITNKITNEAAASISSAPAAATKAASTASANTKANSAASQVRAAATAAQKAATSSQAQTSAAPEISLGSSNTGSAAAQAAARANAAARAGKAAANEVAATAEAKAVESKATATALQNEANAAVAEAIAEQKVATALAVEAKVAADKASTLSAEKIAATTAAKTAAEILVELLKEKVTVAEKIAAAVTVEALAEAQKSLDTVNAKIAEAERTVAETASKADAAISAQVEAVRVAEAAKASAEAQLAKVDQLNAVVPVKAAAAVRAASVAAVNAKIATAAKAAAAKVPSKAVISAKPRASTRKNSTRATISGLKPGQKVKVTVNVKPKP